jgi:4-amino-4-deoxy-L-arabinose transferase-like glycosyltransferase
VSTRPGLIALACCVILSPLWLLTMFDRGIWTPDEPREADIAWRMSTQSQHAIPTLAGEPFAEKPPLAYWASGAVAALIPNHDAALRLPNFVFAWLATSAIVLLAYAMGGAMAAWIAGLTSGTFLLGVQVSAWLATDAALMVGVSAALLGAYRGVKAATLRGQLAWFTLLQIALTWAFLAKGPAALLAPICALLVLLIIERKRPVLRSPGFWLPTIIPVAAVVSWIAAASNTTDGAHSLSVLLWSNVAGRVVHLNGADAMPYSLGHPNYPGKYLVELPFYLAPWIFLFVAALYRAWHRVRDADGSAWRFSVATLTGTVLALSFASTARGIYFAPALPACALLIGLWYAESAQTPNRLDRAMLTATFALVAVIFAALVAVAALVASSDSGRPASLYLLGCGAVLAVITLAVAHRHLRMHRPRSFVTWIFVAYLISFMVTGSVLLPAMDRWQDLSAVVQDVERDVGPRRLVLYRPDETTLAIIDRFTHGSRTATSANTVDDAKRLFDDGGDTEAMLVLLRGHASGALEQRLRSWGIRLPATPSSPELDELATTLGLRAEYVYEVPMGRRYALLARRQNSSVASRESSLLTGSSSQGQENASDTR